MSHPALSAGRTAVITGAASGIGLAAAKKLAAMGMNVCITDITDVALQAAAYEVNEVATQNSTILPVTADVSDQAAMIALAATVRREFDDVAFLMNNAVTRIDAQTWENADAWNRTVAVNIMGVVNGVLAFAPAMIQQSEPSLIVNAGSKQGITNPPGSKPAYNMAKAAVINYTESLQHELRNTDGCRTSAHLLIPGWTTTGTREHQLGAWLPGQVVDYMLTALERGDFYILCPDDEIDIAEDKRRVLWAAGDIAHNRPPLSRWHPDHGDAFKSFEVS
jgi:NAD(P)-dependent dehydrogenase (short-subunit alcohol dehydrogenase family)